MTLEEQHTSIKVRLDGSKWHQDGLKLGQQQRQVQIQKQNAEKGMASSSTCKMIGFEIQTRDIPGAPNENIVQNHLNIALLHVF